MKKINIIYFTFLTSSNFIFLILIATHFISFVSNSKTTPTSNIDAIDSNMMSQTSKDKDTMIHWSRQLGVTCIHCHNLDNFKDDSKPNFKISFKHNQMVKVLQEEVFSERDKGNALKVKVDCYFCHRGKEMPDYIEPPVQLTK